MTSAASQQATQFRWALVSGVVGTFVGALLGAEYAPAGTPLANIVDNAIAAAAGAGMLSAASGASAYRILASHTLRTRR